MPAASSVSAVHSADTALRNVLRRCENAAATMRANSASSAIAGLSSCKRHEPRDGRLHLRRRPERAGRHDEQARDPELRLQHHGEPPVVGRSRRGGHSRDHFLLQHHVQVAQQRVVRGQMEQQRRADVVGQVADDAQVGAKLRIVEFERVGLVERELLGRERRAQPRREVAVDLDGRDVSGALDEAAGQRREAGPDLDQVVAGLRIDRVDDARDVVRVGEKILAEPLARLVSVHATGYQGAADESGAPGDPI